MSKIYRSRTDRLLTGTIGGFAEYFHINSQLLRIIYVILTLLVGHLILGLVIYLVCLVIIPEEPFNNHDNSNHHTRKNLDDVEEYDHK